MGKSVGVSFNVIEMLPSLPRLLPLRVNICEWEHINRKTKTIFAMWWVWVWVWVCMKKELKRREKCWRECQCNLYDSSLFLSLSLDGVGDWERISAKLWISTFTICVYLSNVQRGTRWIKAHRKRSSTTFYVFRERLSRCVCDSVCIRYTYSRSGNESTTNSNRVHWIRKHHFMCTKYAPKKKQRRKIRWLTEHSTENIIIKIDLCFIYFRLFYLMGFAKTLSHSFTHFVLAEFFLLSLLVVRWHICVCVAEIQNKKYVNKRKLKKKKKRRHTELAHHKKKQQRKQTQN